MKVFMISLLLAAATFAQTPTTAVPVPSGASVAASVAALSTVTMPGYVAGGLAFNQDSAAGTPRVNGWISGIFPVASSVGVYESTTADVLPVSKIDPVTQRTVYTFSSSLREGVHKTLYTGTKVQLLLGGDIGGSFTTLPVGTSGTTTAVNLSGSVTVTGVYQFNPHWAAIVPIRGIYTSSINGWVLVPEIGICWKP